VDAVASRSPRGRASRTDATRRDATRRDYITWYSGKKYARDFARSDHTFFTHHSVSIFDRVAFQLTDIYH
jgi:hypothetical protein